jgi:hypothetical protein
MAPVPKLASASNTESQSRNASIKVEIHSRQVIAIKVSEVFLYIKILDACQQAPPTLCYASLR